MRQGVLGDAQRAVEMMTQNDELTSLRIAQELDQDNRRRRAFDEKTFEESIPIADKLIEIRSSEVACYSCATLACRSYRYRCIEAC